MSRLDLTGKKFGKLTAIKYSHCDKKHSFWICKCECGKEIIARTDLLICGRIKSCGCLQNKKAKDFCLSKGANNLHELRIYKIWKGIKRRCYNKHEKAYKDYGGRGIVMCDEWLNDPEKFCRWAYENGYNDKAKKYECTIDRKDVNGNYCPENCHFVNHLKQMQNTRKNVYIQVGQEKYCISEWERILNVSGLGAGIKRSGINYFIKKFISYDFKKKLGVF